MEGASAHLHIIGLHDHAALVGPVPLELQDKVLKVQLCRLSSNSESQRIIAGGQMIPLTVRRPVKPCLAALNQTGSAARLIKQKVWPKYWLGNTIKVP